MSHKVCGHSIRQSNSVMFIDVTFYIAVISYREEFAPIGADLSFKGRSSTLKEKYCSCRSKFFPLTLKASKKKEKKNCSRQHFNFSLLSFEENKAWFFMWILCLAEDSVETSSLISLKNRKNIYECVWMTKIQMRPFLLQSRLALYVLRADLFWKGFISKGFINGSKQEVTELFTPCKNGNKR